MSRCHWHLDFTIAVLSAMYFSQIAKTAMGWLLININSNYINYRHCVKLAEADVIKMISFAWLPLLGWKWSLCLSIPISHTQSQFGIRIHGDKTTNLKNHTSITQCYWYQIHVGYLLLSKNVILIWSCQQFISCIVQESKFCLHIPSFTFDRRYVKMAA